MTTPDGVQITGEHGERYDEVLTEPALAFLADLHRTFDARRLELLAAGRTATRSLPTEARWASCRRRRISATRPGRSHHRRPAWSTVGSRSPARPTPR